MLDVGKLHLWRSNSRWVLNFPTKTTWKRPSELPYVERGLIKFVESYKDWGITSVSFSPLGCGNGNLNWEEVRPMMEAYLARVSIPVYIHDVQVASDFVPEHKEVSRIPEDFVEFSADVRKLAKNHVFSTSKESSFRSTSRPTTRSWWSTRPPARKSVSTRSFLRPLRFSIDERLASIDSFDAKSQRLKSYLFNTGRITIRPVG